MRSINSVKNTARLPKTSDLFERTTAQFPTDCTIALKELRTLILDVQAEHPEIGEISEVLRWKQLSYLTEQTGSGSMLRLGLSKSGKPAMFFHCGTTLIETFRAQYTHLFEFEGNRAMVVTQPVSEVSLELKHCIHQTLTYKLRKAR